MLTFKKITEKAKKGAPRSIAVSDANGKSVIMALTKAADHGLCIPHLVGCEEKILEIVKECGMTNYRIHNETDEIKIAQKAVELVRTGDCDLLMKGKSNTKVLMQAVLDKEKGLRTGNRMSHVTVAEVPFYSKAFMITDGGINPYPDLAVKKMILKNAVQAALALGVENPGAAVLCAQEAPKDDQPETLDALELVKAFENGEFPGLKAIEGPMATDVVFSQKAAQLKGIESVVSGNADILLLPNLAAGNIMAKTILYLVPERIFGGVVMGAKCPIILLSRADEKAEKYNSILLACAMVEK
jgi:phosphate butyryltransferase